MESYNSVTSSSTISKIPSAIGPRREEEAELTDVIIETEECAAEF
jgi:hypothetical protein